MVRTLVFQGRRIYNTSILDEAWEHPKYARLMLNENPRPYFILDM